MSSTTTWVGLNRNIPKVKTIRLANGREKSHKMYIDGQWVSADTEKTFKVHNPATGALVAKIADGGEFETKQAINSADLAFKTWAEISAKERGQILKKARQIMSERVDEIARLVVLENGKPFAEAKGEVNFALGYFDWFAEEARRAYGSLVPSPSTNKRLWVQSQPLGVVAAITPWNFPAAMIVRKIAPALAAGCTVVLKPAEQTPLTALAIAQVCHDAGVPPGVLNVVVGSNPIPISEEMLNNPKVKKIGFTGSTEVGKLLMAKAAKSLKRVSFELGGNAPFIVFDDADLEAAVDDAIAIKYLRVGGQSCICANRIYVQQTIAQKFVTAFVAKTKKLKIGSGFKAGVHCGPLINETARKKVHRLVEDAVARGAEVALGANYLSEGDYAQGSFYAPTVLLKVEDLWPICQEEVFGPVASIMTFQSEEEVIRRANNTNYGLASYLYTRDLGRVVRVSEALEYGLIGVNDAAGYTHEIPFGGVKESGLGREGGKQGLEEYLEVKSIVMNLPH
ncbi:NAD-dependent aldehyde dehydrogenase [Xenococcus sp. PCC 7305]|uniref:NAD-dependent succinate-semialdehyde dehydrogenase n=1 Tax=Xenococcus sp. PCC 7305 TaxID=102125 RepID=UPI0002AC015C|nr:NAD-dependent succinate-semialdehyde dehydrogenase [Xenococcus sp. PCC 7305]ELS03820.1 NAD-dependent aldehyde dehydrogenase [Xenococcus sp. PCC 7305]